MKTPFVYVASATGLGGRWENSYGWLRDDAKASGFQTILLQDSFARKQQVTDLKAAGLEVWAWDEPGRGLTNSRFVEMGYDGVVLQTENPDQRDGALRAFQGGLAAGKERHCVTYFFGFDDGNGASHWANLKAAGVTKMHLECYAPDGHRDAKAYLDTAEHYGFPREDCIIAFGTYRGEFPNAYANTDAVGRNFGCYIVDNWPDGATGQPMTTWNAWGGLNKVSLLNYWRVVGNKSNGTLVEVRATTWTEKGKTVDGLDKVLEFLKGHEQLIRNENGYKLVKVQH